MKYAMILFSTHYPFDKFREAFISPELHVRDKRFNISIIATDEEKNSPIEQDCPSNIQLQCIGRTAFSIPYKSFLLCSIFINKEIYSEILALINNKKFNALNLKKLILFCANAYDKYYSIKKILKREGYIPNQSSEKKVVLYSYWMNATSYAVAKLSKKYNIPAICRVHGSDLYEERSAGYLPMRPYIIKGMKRIFAVSNAGREYLIKRYGNEEKIRCSYLGSMNTYALKEINSKSPFRIVSCAYVIPLKRIECIAEAICGIDDKEIEWVHFGGGRDLSNIDKIIKTAKPNIKCCLKGNVSTKELFDFYANNDVHLFVNFSTTEGGVPQSIKEAMSFGIPAIATNVGGNPEIIRDHINGFLLDVNSSIEQLRRKILDMISLPDEDYLRYRAEAFKEWNGHFNICNTASKFYDEVYGLLK